MYKSTENSTVKGLQISFRFINIVIDCLESAALFIADIFINPYLVSFYHQQQANRIYLVYVAERCQSQSFLYHRHQLTNQILPAQICLVLFAERGQSQSFLYHRHQ